MRCCSLYGLKNIKCCFLYSLISIWQASNFTSFRDISKRILVSRFSASSTSICEFFPVGLFSWQMKGHFSESSVEENVSRMMAATNMWFSEQNKNPSLLPIEGEDIAVWLLVSVISDFDTQHGYISEDSQTNSVGCWRLALLVNNVVILGTTLDPRCYELLFTNLGIELFNTLLS